MVRKKYLSKMHPLLALRREANKKHADDRNHSQ
jgi:hypothetical protein